MERIGGSQISPWPEPGIEEAAAAAFPGEGARRRRGEVGERQEGGESYSGVVLSRSRAAEQWLAGGGERRRRYSSGSGRRGACRGGSADHEEASLGVDLSRGGAEQGFPRRAAGGGRRRLCPRRRRAGGDGGDRPGRGASGRRGWPVPGFSWDQGRAESRAPRWSSSSGGNGGAAAPFWPKDGLARLGEGRGVEREGGTPLGEANGEGRARQEGA